MHQDTLTLSTQWSLESFTDNIVTNNCALLGYYAVYGGNSLLTFRDSGQPTAPIYKGQEILGGVSSKIMHHVSKEKLSEITSAGWNYRLACSYHLQETTTVTFSQNIYFKTAKNKHLTFNPFYKQSLIPLSLAYLTMYKFAVVWKHWFSQSRT